jgi:hypothetical protein
MIMATKSEKPTTANAKLGRNFIGCDLMGGGS